MRGGYWNPRPHSLGMKTDRNTLKRAAYQYLLDHTFPTENGTVVSFLLPKEKDFYGKLMARERGAYIRKTETDITIEATDYKKQLLSLYNDRERVRLRKARFNHLKQNGSLHIKILIRVSKILSDYLEKKAESIRKHEL